MALRWLTSRPPSAQEAAEGSVLLSEFVAWGRAPTAGKVQLGDLLSDVGGVVSFVAFLRLLYGGLRIPTSGLDTFPASLHNLGRRIQESHRPQFIKKVATEVITTGLDAFNSQWQLFMSLEDGAGEGRSPVVTINEEMFAGAAEASATFNLLCTSGAFFGLPSSPAPPSASHSTQAWTASPAPASPAPKRRQHAVAPGAPGRPKQPRLSAADAGPNGPQGSAVANLISSGRFSETDDAFTWNGSTYDKGSLQAAFAQRFPTTGFHPTGACTEAASWGTAIKFVPACVQGQDLANYKVWYESKAAAVHRRRDFV